MPAGVRAWTSHEGVAEVFYHGKPPHVSRNEHTMRLVITVTPALDCGSWLAKASVRVVWLSCFLLSVAFRELWWFCSCLCSCVSRGVILTVLTCCSCPVRHSVTIYYFHRAPEILPHKWLIAGEVIFITNTVIRKPTVPQLSFECLHFMSLTPSDGSGVCVVALFSCCVSIGQVT